MTGKAAVFTGAGKPFDIREYPVSSPGPGQVRLRLLASGICGTDVHICGGRLAMPSPIIPGHEFVGIVEEIGTPGASDALGQTLEPGQAAISYVALPCGRCFSCLNGYEASCLNLGVTFAGDPERAPHFYGGFAEYHFCPDNRLVIIPEDINREAVGAMPCAGPTIICGCRYAGGLKAGELVVVQGTGPVGLFAIAWAAAAGCTVAAIGSSSNPLRLDLARRLGAVEVWDYRHTSIEERLQAVGTLARRLGRGNGADAVIEASGSPAAIPEGMKLCRTLGRYLIPGQYSDSGPVGIEPQLFAFKAISMIGSGQYTLADVNEYMRFLQRRSDLADILAETVTDRYRVEEADEALKNAAAGRSIKAVFIS